MTIRIGSGPTAPPQPAPRKLPLPWLIAGFVVLLVLAGGATVAGILVARHDQSAAPASSPSAVTLSAPEACARMLPLLNAAAKQVTAVAEHPDRDTADLVLTVDGLKALEGQAPQPWREDIRTQYRDLKALADAHGDRGQIQLVALRNEEWLASSLRLTEGCKPYAIG